MNATATLSAAAVLAAGLIGAGIALRPSTDDADLAARIDAATRPLASRVEKLEEDTARLSRERDAALRQGAEALGAALDARKDLDRLRERTDEILAALGAAGPQGARGGRVVVAGGPGLPEGAIVAGGPGAGPEAASSEAAPGAAPAGRPLGSRLSSPAGIEELKVALDEIRKEEAAAQQAKWEQQRKRMKEKRLQTFTEKLGLTPGQAERVQQIWDETQAAREAVFAGMREGTSAHADLKQVMVSTREEEDRKIQETLSPAQAEDYQKLQKEIGQPVVFGATTFEGPAGVATMKEAVIMTAPGGPSPAPGQGPAQGTGKQ